MNSLRLVSCFILISIILSGCKKKGNLEAFVGVWSYDPTLDGNLSESEPMDSLRKSIGGTTTWIIKENEIQIGEDSDPIVYEILEIDGNSAVLLFKEFPMLDFVIFRLEIKNDILYVNPGLFPSSRKEFIREKQDILSAI